MLDILTKNRKYRICSGTCSRLITTAVASLPTNSVKHSCRTCMLPNEEECEFWHSRYWVMCKVEPHGIVAEQGSHLLTPEVSHSVASSSIRRCTVVCAYQAHTQSYLFSLICDMVNEKQHFVVVVGSAPSKGH